MYPHDQTLGSKAAGARRAEVLDTIRDHRYLAGHKLALDEAHERAVAEAARCRLLADAGLAPGWRPAVAGVRRRVGAALVGVGTRLQGASPAETATSVAAAVDPVPRS